MLYLSAFGFVASVIAHLASLVTRVPDAVMLLHMGIFVVWIPAMYKCGRIFTGGRRFSWMEILWGCPRWMRLTSIPLLVYVVLNFTLNLPPQGQEADNAVRLFSGHWMLFYFAAFAVQAHSGPESV